MPVKPSVRPKSENVEEHNLGTTNEPQKVKLSKSLHAQEKNKYVELFKEFKDVFA